jgi:UDP-2,3-diacylglucosamine hydrolase
MKNNPIKIYFASDFHLGAPDHEHSIKREEIIVKWLSDVSEDATEIFLLGDIFDFWFEYNNVIPKGFSRLLGKLAEISDKGIKLHIFTGNHDLWMKDYFVKEMNAVLYKNPVKFNIGNKVFYLAHGDGLGPGDYGYKFINFIFRCRLCQWLFKWLHPDIGISFANFCSKLSRSSVSKYANTFLDEKEWLVIHSRKVLDSDPNVDYLIYGHRHFPIIYPLNNRSSYINLGDMITHFSYAVFDGDELSMHSIDK